MFLKFFLLTTFIIVDSFGVNTVSFILSSIACGYSKASFDQNHELIASEKLKSSAKIKEASLGTLNLYNAYLSLICAFNSIYPREERHFYSIKDYFVFLTGAIVFIKSEKWGEHIYKNVPKCRWEKMFTPLFLSAALLVNNT